MDKIGAAAGLNLAPLKKGNPWGGNYLIDENEGETAGCNKDSISPGSGVPAGSSTVYYSIDTYAC